MLLSLQTGGSAYNVIIAVLATAAHSSSAALGAQPASFNYDHFATPYTYAVVKSQQQLGSGSQALVE
jgi:hypothetical protein